MRAKEPAATEKIELQLAGNVISYTLYHSLFPCNAATLPSSVLEEALGLMEGKIALKDVKLPVIAMVETLALRLNLSRHVGERAAFNRQLGDVIERIEQDQGEAAMHLTNLDLAEVTHIEEFRLRQEAAA